MQRQNLVFPHLSPSIIHHSYSSPEAPHPVQPKQSLSPKSVTGKRANKSLKWLCYWVTWPSWITLGSNLSPLSVVPFLPHLQNAPFGGLTVHWARLSRLSWDEQVMLAYLQLRWGWGLNALWARNQPVDPEIHCIPTAHPGRYCHRITPLIR